jgi:hypothetical protein
MSVNKVPVTFLNGFSAWKGLLGMITFPDMLEGDITFCRFFTFNDGEWGRCNQDFNFDCKSLTYLLLPDESYKAWWLLGKNGEVAEIKAGLPNIDRIPGAGLGLEESYGYVETIKNIENELYVCGYGRQVYKHVNKKWISIADDILTHEKARGFFDIDGVSSNNIFAVGWKGEIYFYDGKKWHMSDSPTSAHLASVCCVKNDDVWICGDNGVVLHGSFNHWTVIMDDAFTDNWYCIEEYDGNIYLAGNGIIGYIDGDSINPVDLGVGRPITTNRLHSKDGQLWSIGEKDILVFDGSSWKEIHHPDNI